MTKRLIREDTSGAYSVKNRRNALVRIFGLCNLLEGTIPDKKPSCVTEKEWKALGVWLKSGKKLIDIKFEDHPEDDDLQIVSIIAPNALTNIAYTRTVGGTKMKSTGKVAASTRSDWWRNCPRLGTLGKLDVSTRPYQKDRATKISFVLPRWFSAHKAIREIEKRDGLVVLFYEIFFCVLQLTLTKEQFHALNEGAYSFRFGTIMNNNTTLEQTIEDVLISHCIN